MPLLLFPKDLNTLPTLFLCLCAYVTTQDTNKHLTKLPADVHDYVLGLVNVMRLNSGQALQSPLTQRLHPVLHRRIKNGESTASMLQTVLGLIRLPGTEAGR